MMAIQGREGKVTKAYLRLYGSKRKGLQPDPDVSEIYPQCVFLPAHPTV